MTIFSWVLTGVRRHKLLITNTILNGSFLATGDLIVQVMQNYYERKEIDEKIQKELEFNTSEKKATEESIKHLDKVSANDEVTTMVVKTIHKPNLLDIDWKRSRNFFLTGFLFGPIVHGWYTFLDGYIPTKGFKSVVQKVISDQLVASPVCIAYFFLATNMLSGNTLEDFVNELRKKFLAAFILDWSVWPAAQTINFTFIPPTFRVLFVSFITLLHAVFLSFLKNSKSKAQEIIDYIDEKLSR